MESEVKRKQGSGGKRENSGRNPVYNEKTGTIAFRVPISHIPVIQEMVAKYLHKVKTKAKAKQNGKNARNPLRNREHLDPKGQNT
jgi:hypothetical protein